MMQRSYLRALFGAGLMGMAGISLAAGIFPIMVSWFFGLNSFEVMLVIRPFIMPLGLLWAVGGGIVGWQGGASTGGMVVGACGIISGFILGALAVDGSFLLILASILSGLVYGTIGGLIIGRAFPKSIGQS